MTRTRLPNRRWALTRDIDFDGHAYAVTVGLDIAGRPAEVFVKGQRHGSALDALLDDCCILASIALQYGARPAELRRSLSRVPALGDALGPATAPASPLGAILDLVADIAEGAAA